MALTFPPNPDPTTNEDIVQGVKIDRTWQYDANKNRWELVGWDSIKFNSELPIKQTVKNGTITTDFDVQDLNAV